MNKYLIASLLLASYTSLAQNKDVAAWADKPRLHTVPAKYAQSPAVIISYNLGIDYKREGNEVNVYRTTHKLIKLLNDRGIEGYNKVKVSVSNPKSIQSIKARTIVKDGIVYEIKLDKIKEIKNEDGSVEFSFAMEGLEKDAEIETVVIEKKDDYYFGGENMQYFIPSLHSEINMSTPYFYKFELKGYYGFPTGRDTLVDSTRYYHAQLDDIPAQPNDESYANEEALRMREDYRLSYTTFNNENVRRYTWNDLIQRVYKRFYTNSDRETRALDKFMATLDIKGADTDPDKIQKIEEGIKNNIVLNGNLDGENASDIDQAVIKKTTTKNGMIKLFAACLTAASVKHELGLTTNRYFVLLDENFENWLYMDNYLIYFPATKRYLAPTSIYDRYPFIPDNYLTNKGIFCKTVSLGGITSALVDMRTISVPPISESESNIDARLTFNGDNLDPVMDITYSFTGYVARGTREGILYLAEDKKKEVVTAMTGVASSDNIISYKIENAALNNYYANIPLTIQANIKAGQLMDKAGSKYLLKVGDIIGRQKEMYDSTQRKLPIDIGYAHSFNRKINITIPKGYKILNPDDINILAEFKNDNGKVTMGFKSAYTLDGDQLNITIHEWYDQLHCEVKDFEMFRKVINASADFNKVNLLLGKT